MRTTIRLPDDLLREVKKRAAERGIPLTRLIEEALRESFARSREAEVDVARVSLTTVGGSGVHPGVDLHNAATLHDVMQSGSTPG